MKLSKLHHQDDAVTLFEGDCRPWLDTQPQDSVDAIITDSPYEVGIGGAAWDRTGVTFEVATWQRCFRVLKPGAILVNFALPKLYHRMATAVEDAGFEILDFVDWFYAQGKPASSARLKPAHEPVIVAMKPMSERTIQANRERWGTGGLWPEGAPIVAAGGERGRWPSNVVLSHADECAEACIPGCRVLELNTQSGIRKSGKMRAGTIRGRKPGGAFGAMPGAPMDRDTIGDEGGASRFYFVSKVKGADRLGHLSEKPEDLMEHIIRWAAPPHPSRIVDPFAGSGPTLEAARRLGHRAVGVELERAHCQMCSIRFTRNMERRKAAQAR